MSERVNLSKASPDLYKSMAEMDQLAVRAALDAGFSHGFAHLLKLRASQINQCAFCVRMHARDAVATGESADRLSVLAAWRESGYFDDKERAALALMESVTLVAEGQIPDAVYEQSASALNPAQIAAVQWLGVIINSWNRIAIASRYPVNP